MTISDFLYFALIIILTLSIFAVFWLAGGYILFRQVDAKLRKCPNCKKGGAGDIIETNATPLGSIVDYSGKEAVRIKSEKVVDNFECNRCGHTWQRSFERKERYPLHDHNPQRTN